MKKIDKLAIDNLRVMSAQMINRAHSGHTGIALGAAPTMFTLFSKIMQYNPKNPNFLNRDRLVLSAGHASALYYACLDMFGFKLSKNDLKNFRQLNSITPGHPEFGLTSGVEVSTGPLGQGIANAVGMALGIKKNASEINKSKFNIFDANVFCFAGEGCLMEGISNEAMSLAGTWNLDNLILIYDCNEITIEGKSSLSFNENLKEKMQSLNWDYFEVNDGENVDLIEKTIKKAILTSKKPKFIKIKTKIGAFSELEGSEKIHGIALTNNQLEKLKRQLNCDISPFSYNEEVKYFENWAKDRGQRLEWEWNLKIAEYKLNYVSDFEKISNLQKPEQKFKKAIESLEKMKFNDCYETRDYAHICLNFLNMKGVDYFGGTADVAPSTKAFLENQENLHFGVREHAMGAICNGLALTVSNRIFCSTFLPFMDYMKNSIRMSALMSLPVLYIFSHDSFYVGEDGPTHQPVEHLVNLRATPNLTVFRPYNAQETSAGFIYNLLHKNPTVIVINKNKDKKIATEINDCLMGAYEIGQKFSEFDLIFIATGSEVSKALNVQEELLKKDIKVRVISMPSIEVFKNQSETYKEKLLPKNFEKVVCIEAGSSYSWHQFAGKKGLIISKDTFGKSGKPEDLEVEFGFDKQAIINKILKFLKNFE